MAQELDKKVLDKNAFTRVQDEDNQELVLYTLPTDDSAFVEDALQDAIRKQIDIQNINEEDKVKLLSTTNLPLNANGDVTIYTVPNNQRCVLVYAIIVAGSDAGATTTVAIGQDGAETNFVPANTLSNLDAQNDAVIIRPVPSTTPPKNKSYGPNTVIQAQVGTQSGGGTNTIYLFGFLY
jgi:hypothetical protein